MHNSKLQFSMNLGPRRKNHNYLAILVVLFAIVLVVLWHPMYKANEDAIYSGASPKARAFNRFNYDIIGNLSGKYDDLEFSDDTTDDVLMDYIDYDKIIANAAAENGEVSDIGEAVDGETKQILLDQANREHTVVSGDTLLSVLTSYGMNKSEVYLISRQHKQLTNLRIGQSLNWQVDKDNRLIELTWVISNRETRHYVRKDDNFIETKDVQQGQWQNVVLTGSIKNSFVDSAKAIGLSGSEISQIIKALQWQFDFKKLRNGDRFVVLLSREMLSDGSSQGSELLGVRLMNGKDNYYSIGFNGRFYNKQGAGFSKGFLRYPLKKTPRISSNFNPKRLHPVTRRIAPHNGVDFAVPIGTPVIAPADGVVAMAQYSGSAGNFIVVGHGSQYLTRYMHLSKIMVKPGQKVNQGDVIGLSGNSGRSTGPHLHYEIHIDKKPVDAMKAKLPTSQNLTGKAKASFTEKARDILSKLTL